MCINVKIIGVNVIDIKEGEELTLRDIYDRMERYYRTEDARAILDQEENDDLLWDKDGNYISDEQYTALCEEVAEVATRGLEKNDSYWDRYWDAFNCAVIEVRRQNNM